MTCLDNNNSGPFPKYFRYNLYIKKNWIIQTAVETVSPFTSSVFAFFETASLSLADSGDADRFKMFDLNETIMAVMLSQPVPSPSVFGAKQWSNIYNNKKKNGFNYESKETDQTKYA